MKKLIVALFACMCIFSSCSARGYWMPFEPIARPDGTYHLSDQIRLEEEGDRLWLGRAEPTNLFFCYNSILASDDFNDIIIPVKAHDTSYNGTKWSFTLVRLRVSTSTCSVIREKHFVRPFYGAVPSPSDWEDFNGIGDSPAVWWVRISWASKDIKKHFIDMKNQGKGALYKHYELIED